MGEHSDVELQDLEQDTAEAPSYVHGGGSQLECYYCECRRGTEATMLGHLRQNHREEEVVWKYLDKSGHEEVRRLKRSRRSKRSRTRKPRAKLVN